MSAPPPLSSLAAVFPPYLADLATRNYSPATIASRKAVLRRFATWAAPRGVTEPRQITLAVLESYQQALARHRRPDGRPLSWGGQAQQLVTLRHFLQWATRQRLLRHNPAQALRLPRRPQHLPRAVLSAAEVESVLVQPDIATPLGLRDRALLEVLYSTGIRRLELIHLALPDLDPVRGVCFVREGKGQKDRVVPIGQRALAWVERYLQEARPQLVVPPDDGTLLLTVRGRPLATNRLSELVHRYVTAAGLRGKGSCHVFRHTLATLLLQGGADVRHIQAILGHADLRTTARYTHVVIDELKAVHQRAHPAEQPLQPPTS
ncbi:MAG: site-specific tyrosine recombinase XerC [Phycisphaerales bacterium]|nr:site-specific tyrosine recombinase XerC [Phycisphaerales bacterium]